jgi:enoyl-[acyl-carrier protein] reductase I
VTDPAQVDALVAEVRTAWDTVDFVVHSIAFANPDELRGRFRDTTRPGFVQALEVSCYSLIPVARAFAEIMPNGGSILALSYLGGERVVPNYNVMGVAKAALDAAVRYLAYDLGTQGIRVNAIAPGPVKTVSAAAIGDFGRMLDHVQGVAPLRRNVTAAEVGDVAAFLLSDLARALTGTHLPVDCGYSILGAVADADDGTAPRA